MVDTMSMGGQTAPNVQLNPGVAAAITQGVQMTAQMGTQMQMNAANQVGDV
jgi:hypothetical protein